MRRENSATAAAPTTINAGVAKSEPIISKFSLY
jgi:hypothetical protein